MKEGDIRRSEAHTTYLRLVIQDVERLLTDDSSFEAVGCPACAGRDYVLAMRKDRFQYVQCTECRTIFVTPRPPRKMLDEFYAASESSRYWVHHFFMPVAEARREQIFRPRAEFIARVLAEAPHDVVADVGAGFGLFLEELKAAWPSTRLVAIEPSPDMAAFCRARALETRQTTVEELTGWDGQFDIVTAFELLEHLYDPSSLVVQAFRLLRPGGHLVLTTLNGEGFDIQVLWERSRSVFPPHHLNFLNPSSLVRLCEHAGFDVISSTTPGRLDWDIVEQAIARGEGSADRFWSVVAGRASEAAKQELQEWISRHGLSSHMQVVARKPATEATH